MEIIEKTTFDRLYALQVAMIVSREKSFSRAALLLNISPSNVTKEIGKLEASLGVKIFNRTTRSIALTEEGRVALSKSRVILDEFNDLKEQMRGESHDLKGQLRVTAPSTLGQNFLAPLFAQFQIENPYIELDLIFTDTILDPVAHNIDLCIRTAFKLPDSPLYAKEVTELDRVICASKEYIKRFNKPLTIDALEKHNCLVYLRGDTPFVWTMNKKGQTRNISVTGSFKSNNLKTLVSACEKGIGILNTPRYLVDEHIKKGDLEVLFKSWSLPGHRLFLLSPRRPSSLRKLLVLEEFLTSRLN